MNYLAGLSYTVGEMAREHKLWGEAFVQQARIAFPALRHRRARPRPRGGAARRRAAEEDA
jgi:hypothetical protein|eukprot:COSAG01_NODE_8975_length_2597_cov_11.843875_5_plen_60_part_00